MRKIQLSQNNEAFICICDSSCEYRHKLMKVCSNTRNKNDKDFCTKYNVQLKKSEELGTLCCEECIKAFRNRNTQINKVEEYKGNEVDCKVDIRELEESIF